MNKDFLLEKLPNIPKRGQLRRLILQAPNEEFLIAAIERHNLQVPDSFIEMIKGSGRAEE